MRSIGVVLFPEFELLDVFGPLEMFGLLPEAFEIRLVGQTGPLVASKQGPRSALDDTFADDRHYDLLLIPGGRGARREVENETLLAWLRRKAEAAEIVTTVCTGSAILARSGLLDGIGATTNKMAFDWAASFGPDVRWQKQARWVEAKGPAGHFFTSSGVSAGMDMSLAVIAHLEGEETARQVALWAEYDWHDDPTWDPFAAAHGLA